MESMKRNSLSEINKMKYVATIITPTGRLSDSFPTVVQAEQWLDLQNKNQAYTTIVNEVDDNNMIVDWFYYTEAAR